MVCAISAPYCGLEKWYTNNPEIIGPFLEKKERHWKSECINCYYLQKRFRNKNNMTLKDYLEI